jgi:hypothetical protein
VTVDVARCWMCHLLDYVHGWNLLRILAFWNVTLCFWVNGVHCCEGTRCVLLTLKWTWHGIIFQNTRVLSCTAVNTQHSQCVSCWEANDHWAGYMLCLLWVWTFGYQFHQGLPSWLSYVVLSECNLNLQCSSVLTVYLVSVMMECDTVERHSEQ